MPIINGKKVRATFTKLDLDELSSVDMPAQPGAKMSIMKRDTEAARAEIVATISKYVTAEDGAHTFQEVVRENQFSEKIWPYLDAFSQSVRSIAGDASLSVEVRDSMIETTTEQFLSAVREVSPAVEKQLSAAFIKQKDDPMTDQNNDVAKLEAEVSTLKADLAKMADEKTEAETAQAAALEELDETKKALAEATDEVITINDTEIRKSVVGEATFAVNKALIAERDMARFEKRASQDYSHVVGKAEDVARVLKARESMDEETQKALDAVLKAAESMSKAGFNQLGAHGVGDTSVTKARGDFTGKIADIQKRDNCDRTTAMSKARSEYPEEHRSAYPEQYAN